MLWDMQGICRHNIPESSELLKSAASGLSCQMPTDWVPPSIHAAKQGVCNYCRKQGTPLQEATADSSVHSLQFMYRTQLARANSPTS